LAYEISIRVPVHLSAAFVIWQSNFAAFDESLCVGLANIYAVLIAIHVWIAVVCCFRGAERLRFAQLAAKCVPDEFGNAVIDALAEPECQWSAVVAAKCGSEFF